MIGLFTCDFHMWSHTWFTYDVGMWCWYVMLGCDFRMWCSHVITCDVHMWFWYVMFTCELPPKSHTVSRWDEFAANKRTWCWTRNKLQSNVNVRLNDSQFSQYSYPEQPDHKHHTSFSFHLFKSSSLLYVKKWMECGVYWWMMYTGRRSSILVYWWLMYTL